MRSIKSIDSDSGGDGDNQTRGEVAMLFDERRSLSLYVEIFFPFNELLRTFIRQQHHYQKTKFPPLLGYRET